MSEGGQKHRIEILALQVVEKYALFLQSHWSCRDWGLEVYFGISQPRNGLVSKHRICKEAKEYGIRCSIPCLGVFRVFSCVFYVLEVLRSATVQFHSELSGLLTQCFKTSMNMMEHFSTFKGWTFSHAFLSFDQAPDVIFWWISPFARHPYKGNYRNTPCAIGGNWFDVTEFCRVGRITTNFSNTSRCVDKIVRPTNRKHWFLPTIRSSIWTLSNLIGVSWDSLVSQ